MISLLKYLSDYKKETFLAPFFKLLEAFFDLLTPLVVAAMIDQGIAPGNRRVVYWSLGAMVTLACVGIALAATAQYFAAKAATGFASRLRRATFARIQRFSFAQLDRFGADSLATRMTNDANQVQTGANLTLRLLLRSPIVVFGAIVMAFLVDAKGALVFLAVFPPLALVVFAIVLASLPIYAENQRRLDALAVATRENLVGARVIRAFNMERNETGRFETLASLLYRTQQKAGALAGLMNPATYLIVNLGIVALIATGATRVQVGTATQGETVALINYMTQILVELIKLANLLVQTNKSLACGKRLAEVLDEPEDMIDGTLELPEAAPGDSIVSFRDVSLTYPGAADKSLDGITFDAKVGQTVGIVGGVGSGKTSLVNLIPRFYDATEGDVLIFGRDVREYRLGSLRAAIGVAPQSAELFQGTVASNLRWGREDASDDELYSALNVAQATDFVPLTPEGLATPVEQGGRNFSGGQRRRLTVARALVRRPRILILDDASSALDNATDARLRAALRETKVPETTTFIVAQRAVAVRDADLILVLDEGKLVGAGTHDALLRENETYREICRSQFPDEEKGGAK